MNPPTMRVPGAHTHALESRDKWHFGPAYVCGCPVAYQDTPSEDPVTCEMCLRILAARRAAASARPIPDHASGGGMSTEQIDRANRTPHESKATDR